MMLKMLVIRASGMWWWIGMGCSEQFVKLSKVSLSISVYDIYFVDVFGHYITYFNVFKSGRFHIYGTLRIRKHGV